MRPTWEIILDNLVYDVDDNRITIEEAESKFREEFPGNYKLVRIYSTRMLKWNIKMEFKSRNEELLFQLQNV